MKSTKSILFLASLPAWCGAAAAQELVQVRQDFSEDPGWEGLNNRIEASDPPTIQQDFGWIGAHPAGGQGGSIGGVIWQSTTPAYYAMPIGKPLTFDEPFTASGKIAFKNNSGSAAAYVGFFNHERQGWRPWSSVAIRVGGLGIEIDTGAKGMAAMHLDYMTALWGGGGAETDISVPVDGSAHDWKLTYDPAATPPDPWPDPNLKKLLSNERRTVEQILPQAAEIEPGITRDQLEKRLQAAVAEGLISSYPRRDEVYWTLKKGNDSVRGAVRLQIDDRPVKNYVSKAHREQPLTLDRFGIFNFQLYHRSQEFFVWDLTVNGERIDLSHDPAWEARGNRVQFVERDFHRQDFGYSATHWAGEKIGEMGGTVARCEPQDPLHGYYADDVGSLTLEDPISFSGHINFVEGATDAGALIGFFNREQRMQTFTDPTPNAGEFINDTLAIEISGPTRAGYYFMAHCSPKKDLASRKNGPLFLPTRQRRAFSFQYDPQANNRVGRITITLDQETFALDLTPAQRAAGATFDRFGLMSPRAGGKYVTLYLDDLTYTARRPADHKPVRHERKIIAVPYPEGGRKY